MVGVPAAADIHFLVRFLRDQRDLGIAIRMSEEPVYVDFAKAARRCDMLLRRQSLFPEHNDTVFGQNAADALNRLLGKILAQIDPTDLGSGGTRHWTNLQVIASHRGLLR